MGRGNRIYHSTTGIRQFVVTTIVVIFAVFVVKKHFKRLSQSISCDTHKSGEEGWPGQHFKPPDGQRSQATRIYDLQKKIKYIF